MTPPLLRDLRPGKTGFAVIDVETTGFTPRRDRIVEIAVVRTDSCGRVLDEWCTLVNPGRPVGATHIHGITSAQVRRAPRFVDIVGELNVRLAGRALVAHNAVFDLSFLRSEYARAGWEMPDPPYLCTLEASWIYLPDLVRRRLPDCCEAVGVLPGGAHSALGDARAAAGLLAAYLDPNSNRAPTRQHMRLPAQAAGVVWPRVSRSPVVPVLRGESDRLPVPAAPGTLATLVRGLPSGSAADEGAPVEAATYLELLSQVLEDGILTDAEVQALVEVTSLYSLTREQVEAAHRAFLLAMAHRAVEDGTVTLDERAALLDMATTLGADTGVIKGVLDEAYQNRLAERSMGRRPLPEGWHHGEPLRVGQRVVFTGCDDLERLRLEAAAKAAGLRVTSAVSRLTAVLVTDGANTTTVKAVTARKLGTRVVDPRTFAQLLDHIQPAWLLRS
ncbi:MAG TPA: exonuclease domain-containing protein [Mycobacteriales bacterium]